jgi:MFS family permease
MARDEAKALESPAMGEMRAEPARKSASGLDWFVFFLADIQTGFGPFVAVYLTSQAWTQGDIGLILSAGGLVALAGQLPAGALVDMARSARLMAGVAVVGIGLSALALALWPIFIVVLAARVLHAAASCVLGPAVASISLGLVGHGGLGERLGRNARFASIGNGAAAAAMGLCGHLVSSQAVFFLTASLALPALFALAQIRTLDTARIAAGTHAYAQANGNGTATWRDLLRDRRLLIFSCCILLFQLANAATLPLMAGILTVGLGDRAAMVIAAAVVVPQLVVVAMSPWVGRQSEHWGRRPLLMLCFAALVIRCALFALVTNPYLVVAVQLLDGVSAAVLAVLFPLIVADITRDTGRFSLALGIVGSAIGIGAALSTTLAGFMHDQLGAAITFYSLAGVAVLGLALVWLLMAETRPEDE